MIGEWSKVYSSVYGIVDYRKVSEFHEISIENFQYLSNNGMLNKERMHAKVAQAFWLDNRISATNIS